MTSGLRRGIEINVDRPGNDIVTVDLADPIPEDCQTRCESNPSCRAWSLVTKPSGLLGGDVNRCSLKSSVSEAKPTVGVFSGRRGMFSF